ncbi:hypothetical protein [Treponema ruminis]|uniref:Lipoprotein n=1 Tax=Treponema ruminis TaxID=744515 RepID=A0A7W8LMS6_9SPIR|nr:hypothetical protein [Treponema ruminis]MBB5226787.1 hypothetical protein [Treponema ruminis]
MKKIVLISLSLAVFASSLFAKSNPSSSLFSGINKVSKKMDKSAVNGVEGTIPEGKTLRGGFYLLTQVQPEDLDKKVKNVIVEIKSIDLLNDSYSLRMKAISKIAIGFSCQDSTVTIAKTDNGFISKVEELTSYGSDVNGSATGEIHDMSAKYFDEIAKWYTDEIISLCKKTSDEDFSKADAELLTLLPCYYDVSKTAGNKLKAKKWYNEHSIEGLPISGSYNFWGIDESKVPGFAYELKFSFFDNNLNAHFFSVLSNNDSYIELKEDTKVEVVGTIRSVKFSDFGNDYKVSELIITEK